MKLYELIKSKSFTVFVRDNDELISLEHVLERAGHSPISRAWTLDVDLTKKHPYMKETSQLPPDVTNAHRLLDLLESIKEAKYRVAFKVSDTIMNTYSESLMGLGFEEHFFAKAIWRHVMYMHVDFKKKSFAWYQTQNGQYKLMDPDTPYFHTVVLPVSNISADSYKLKVADFGTRRGFTTEDCRLMMLDKSGSMSDKDPDFIKKFGDKFMMAGFPAIDEERLRGEMANFHHYEDPPEGIVQWPDFLKEPRPWLKVKPPKPKREWDW